MNFRVISEVPSKFINEKTGAFLAMEPAAETKAYGDDVNSALENLDKILNPESESSSNDGE